MSPPRRAPHPPPQPPLGDGVLEEQEFKSLVRRVSPARDEEEINELLVQVDPGQTMRVTFSDSVTVLSPDIVDMMIVVARTVTQTDGSDDGW